MYFEMNRIGAVVEWEQPQNLKTVFWDYQNSPEKRPYWEWFHEFILSYNKNPQLTRTQTKRDLSRQGVIDVLNAFGINATRKNGSVAALMSQETVQTIIKALEPYIDDVVGRGLDQAVRTEQVAMVQKEQRDIVE